MYTSMYGAKITSAFYPSHEPTWKTPIDFFCKKRKGTKKKLRNEKLAMEQSKNITEPNDNEEGVVEVWETRFPKRDLPGNYIVEDGELVKEVGFYSTMGYENPDRETKKHRAERLKKIYCTDVRHEEGNDIYWPPVPGLEVPEEESAEVVGNMNKPRPIDPEEEEKYRYMDAPSLREIDDQFMMKGRDFWKLIKKKAAKKFDLFADDNWN